MVFFMVGLVAMMKLRDEAQQWVCPNKRRDSRACNGEALPILQVGRFRTQVLQAASDAISRRKSTA
jgi:hypothetical protein